MLTSSVTCWRHYFLVTKNVKNFFKMMKIVNIHGENLRIFWTTWGISMKFSGKIWLMIILKATKMQDFIFSLEDTFLEKPQRGQIDPPILFRVNYLRWKLDNLSNVLKDRLRISLNIMISLPIRYQVEKLRKR